MTENCINHTHVKKLGHILQEIRERTLLNIISKLDHGFVFDNHLARSRELLIKLFEWFNFEQFSHEEKVLMLIKRIILTESGSTIVNHIGYEAILNDIEDIQQKVHNKYHHLINDIVEVLRPASAATVPPLLCTVPLSYRSCNSNHVNTPVVGSTATPIEGHIYESTFKDDERGSLAIDETYRKNHSAQQSFIKASLPNMLFTWQPLVAPDLHVLESVEESLNSSQAANLMNSCEFFSDVMLQDYPAEVFIQRPNIINLFFSLLETCAGSRHQLSILHCLDKLTTCLHKRIQFYNDPCTHNLKEQKCTLYTIESGTLNNPPNSCRSKCSGGSVAGAVNEMGEDSAMLKVNRVTLPHFCIKLLSSSMKFLCRRADSLKATARKKMNQEVTNIALCILDNGFSLLCKCVKCTIYDNRGDKVVSSVVAKLFLLFTSLGETLEYFRLGSASCELKYYERSVFLRLLCITKRTVELLVPLGKADLVLPMSLKKAVAAALLDVPVALMYRDIHDTLLEYAETFSGQKEIEYFSKYKSVKAVNAAASSAVEFLKRHAQNAFSDNVTLVRDSLASLDFHRNFALIKLYVELCANKMHACRMDENAWSSVDDVTLSLLGHSDADIRAEMYSLCHKRIKAVMDPTLNVTVNNHAKQVYFILRPAVLVEFVAHGMISDNIQIQTRTEEMLIYVLKCKLLVPKETWQTVLEALIPALPLLLCHAGKSTPLGRIIIGILDPDTADSLQIPKIEVLKGNLRLLLNEDALAREECLSRLCWLLATEPNAHEYMPRLTNLQNSAMNSVCIVQQPVDLSQAKPQQFYQPSSLAQVLELLRATDVEPAIRRSALTQVCVMCEDPVLHATFLDGGGLDLVLRVLRRALKETAYSDYPDSVIPVVGILKNMCLFNPWIRQQLSLNQDVFYCILRGLLLFCAEERMKQDSAILLCVLLYSDFALGTPMQGGVSLPQLVVQTLSVPFLSQVHWKTSRYAKPGLVGVLLNDQFCKSAIKLHFCVEYLGGYGEIMNMDNVDNNQLIDWNQFNEALKLNANDVRFLQTSCVTHCCKRYLQDIQNATSHSLVIESILQLTGCIHLYDLTKAEGDDNDILSLPWESTLARFVNAPPAGDSDVSLLNAVLKFLQKVVLLHRDPGDCWIINALKQPNHCVHDVLKEDENVPLVKTLCQNLLTLLASSVSVEQQRRDFQMAECANDENNWSHVVQTIHTSLESNDTQHFYNLAYLDCMLSCLVTVTSNLGWSNSKSNAAPQKPLPQLVTRLCELINAFHCGKGPSATTSLMGLSITRNSVMILNHVLAEMQYCNAKQWELCWFDFYTDSDVGLGNLCSLWLSRDVIVRAAIFQLLAGIASSLSGANKLVENGKSGIWDAALTILTDHGEASIVREQAASLIANLVGHTYSNRNDAGGDSVQTALYLSLLPPSLRCAVQATSSSIDAILLLFEEHSFFKETTVILWCLNVETCASFVECDDRNDGEFRFIEERASLLPIRDEYDLKYTKSNGETTVRSVSSNGSDATDDDASNGTVIITTPGLIKSMAKLYLNVFSVAPEKIAALLQEHNLVKEFFRCLRAPTCTVLNNVRDVLLYCDILEMCEHVCELLNQVAQSNASALGTLRNSRDCLNVLVGLMNANVYYTQIPHLLHLRNRMWTEAFNLLATLIGFGPAASDSLALVSALMKDCSQETFLQTVCEAIGSSYCSDLQHSALSSLISLLRLEHINAKEESPRSESFSMQSLLDNTKTPRSRSSPHSAFDVFSVQKNSCKSERNAIEAFKNIIYNSDSKNKRARGKSPKVMINNEEDDGDDDDEELAIGAQVCKILMHLYDLCNITGGSSDCVRKKQLVINALTCALCTSREAKRYALRNGFAAFLVDQLREIHIKLSLESAADAFRHINDRKRVCPLMKETNSLLALLTNFMLGDESVKYSLSQLGLADFVHKFWIWFCLQKPLLEDALKMLCTFTTNCLPACQTLTLTSAVAGSGPRRSPSNMNLISALVALTIKEMDLISKTHDLKTLKLCFHVLNNCCSSLECRVVLSKSNLLQCLNRLHPVITKRQKPWESVELLWLELLQSYTVHAEGQTAVAKFPDALEIILTLSGGPKTANREAAIVVLKNIAFNPSNRSRLLASDHFLKTLHAKLAIGSDAEKKNVVLTIWAIVANNQKAKILLKSAGIGSLLQELLRQHEIKSYAAVSVEDAAIIHYVCHLFNDGGERGR